MTEEHKEYKPTRTVPVKKEHLPIIKELLTSTALSLKGNPEKLDKELTTVLKALEKAGIAADFGDDGWGRGHKWHSFVRNQ